MQPQDNIKTSLTIPVLRTSVYQSKMFAFRVEKDLQRL